ncbi:hypothetical protein B0H16DRAFT_1453381 [Mycena metata]|uniref:Nephrocystin 3-like N-terminal domain-containing protein n=1 Tax=Mycena metata TaxID=1033252 RepID=A0AAD7JN72_9AGAR|nr:hypothetical protein B0H16DRAFT_1453381 [Mycena metata]
MPLLSNSTGFQVHGGNFYEVHGDINIHQVQADLQIENNEGATPGISTHRPGGGVLQTLPWRDSYSEGRPNLHRASIHTPSESATLPTPRPQPGSPGGTYFSAENLNYIHRHGIQAPHQEFTCSTELLRSKRYTTPLKVFPSPDVIPKLAARSWETCGNELPPHILRARMFAGSMGPQARGNQRSCRACVDDWKMLASLGELALHNPGLKLSISERVESDPSLVGASISSQLRELIVGPCKSSGQSAPQILLIDGLDECVGVVVQQEVLRAIRAACVEEPPSLRVIIASRPEPDISAIFEDPWFRRFHKQVNVEQSFEDVRKYLHDEFSRIHHEHRETMSQTPKPWPSEDVIQLLVSRSSGYFVYAATVIKFVDDRDFRPTHRLRELVESPTLERGDSDESPFQALDELYLQVLRSVPAPSRLALRRLHSVLRIPSEQSNSRISVYHASFSEFLLDLTRSGEFCISTPQHSVTLARAILKAMSYNQPHNQTPEESVAWQLRDDGIHFVSFCTPPSADLLALFHSLNPDYFWPDYDFFGTETLGNRPSSG